MTTAFTRLQEKIDQQTKTTTDLRNRFRDAMTIAVTDEGFCLDELQYFGTKAFQEVLSQMRSGSEEQQMEEMRSKT